MVSDMTRGKPIRLITAFAVPLFIGNIFHQIYNMVDSIVVGNFVGPNALAAVGCCGPAFNLMIALLNGMSGGMSVLIAQYFGAKNEKMVKRAFLTATVVISLVGIFISLLGILLTRPLLLALHTPPEILPGAQIYLRILFIGTLAHCMYSGMTAVLQAMGDSLIPLLALIVASLLNVGLDLLFVLVFDLGVAGVGIATVLSQFLSAVACVVYVFHKLPMLRFGLRELRADREMLWQIVRIGLPSALSSGGVSLSVMFMQRAINSFGATVAAAYSVGCRAEQVGMCLAYSIGMAVGTFCGQNIGARQYDRVKRGLRTGYLLSVGYALLVAALMFLLGRPLARLFTDAQDVIDIAVPYIYIVSAFAPVLGLVFVYQNFLRSAGDIVPTIWMSLTEIIARSVLAFLFAWLFGHVGIWWVTPVGWTASLIIGFFRFRSGKWQQKLDIPDAAQS